VRSLAFLQAEWIPTLTDYTSIQYQSPSATWYDGIHKVSSSDWGGGSLERRPNDQMIIL